MEDPEQLRAHAVRLFAMAIDAREINPEYADRLVAEATELQDRAAAIEEAARAPSPPEAPQQPTQQQQQEQVQLEKDVE